MTWDKDGDNLLDEEEFTAYIPEEEFTAYIPAIKVFHALDTDKSGAADRVELQRALEVLKRKPESGSGGDSRRNADKLVLGR